VRAHLPTTAHPAAAARRRRDRATTARKPTTTTTTSERPPSKYCSFLSHVIAAHSCTDHERTQGRDIKGLMLPKLSCTVYLKKTGHQVIGYWTTRGSANSRIANSRTGQLADAAADFACLVFALLAASARPQVDQSARCPVRDLSSPRVDQSTRSLIRELAIRELANPRVLQLAVRPLAKCERRLLHS